MTDGPNRVGEWIIFCAAMTGLAILGLMILFIGILAIVYMVKLIADIIENGF